VLLRHGQSAWNQANQFTGWIDDDLTDQGIYEARRAGEFLHQAEFYFDIAYTSMLKRAIRTLWIVLEEIDQLWLPSVKDWRFNERHYGVLQGLNKTQTADLYGKEQVFQWRRSYNIRPPALAFDDPRHPHFDPRYATVDPRELPVGESLQDTLERVLVVWQEKVLPDLRLGKRVLVVAHGNSLRALVKHLDQISEQEIPGVNNPTGIPLHYDLDEFANPIRRTYLGDRAVIQAALDDAARAAQVRDSQG